MKIKTPTLPLPLLTGLIGAMERTHTITTGTLKFYLWVFVQRERQLSRARNRQG